MMKKNEKGRSMVEMLGVLAIIGVLSIGGIAGYTLAMNRYRANEIMQVVSMCSVAAQTARSGIGLKSGDTTNCLDLLALDEFPYGLKTAVAGVDTNVKRVTISFDSNTVAERVGAIIDQMAGSRVVAGTCEKANNPTTCTIEINEES